MKIETTEDELRLLKIDIGNLREEIYELKNSNELIMHNLELLFQHNSLNLRHKYKCKNCMGTGEKFCMDGPDDCKSCNKSGCIWR